MTQPPVREVVFEIIRLDAKNAEDKYAQRQNPGDLFEQIRI